MNILVAEDDKVVSLLVCGILRAEGHHVLAAYDQMQTIMFANKPPSPDAIVLDLNMPGGAGGEALRRLMSSTVTSAVPVVVLSASTYASAPELVRKLGGESFLAKPVDRATLLVEIDRVTSGSHSAQVKEVPANPRMMYS